MKNVSTILLAVGLVFTSIGSIRSQRHSEYWRKQYDAEKAQLLAIRNTQTSVRVCFKEGGDSGCYNVPGMICTMTTAATAATAATASTAFPLDLGSLPSAPGGKKLK